jgi:hypothetical protein
VKCEGSSVSERGSGGRDGIMGGQEREGWMERGSEEVEQGVCMRRGL